MGLLGGLHEVTQEEGLEHGQSLLHVFNIYFDIVGTILELSMGL